MKATEANWSTLISGLEFAEGPLLWPSGEVWCVDVGHGAVVAITPDGSTRTVCTVPGALNALAFDAAGRVLGVDNGGMRPVGERWEMGQSSPSLIASIDSAGRVTPVMTSLDADGPGHRLNDLCSDGAGGFYFTDSGNWEALFSASASGQYRGGAVYHLDASGEVRLAVDVADFPNGIVVRPGGQAVVVAHTLTGSIWQYQVADDRTLVQPRLLADLRPIDDRLGPDGLVLLVDGSLVVAGNRADKLVRIAPDGEVLDVIETPGDWGPTNIAAGDGYLMVTMGRGGRLCRIDVPWPAGQV